MDKTALYARDLSGVEWSKSSHSTVIEESECVEVAVFDDGAVALRDSTDHTRAPLRFTAREWARSLRGSVTGSSEVFSATARLG